MIACSDSFTDRTVIAFCLRYVISLRYAFDIDIEIILDVVHDWFEFAIAANVTEIISLFVVATQNYIERAVNAISGSIVEANQCSIANWCVNRCHHGQSVDIKQIQVKYVKCKQT